MASYRAMSNAAGKKQPPITISATQLHILAELDRQPLYGAAIVEKNPHLFIGRNCANDGTQLIEPGLIYMRLARLKERGLIERIDGYKPPSEMRIPYRTRLRAVWYRLTPEGRDVIRQHRKLVQK